MVDSSAMASGRKGRAEAVRLYQETDLSAEEIGRRFNVSRQTVHRWVADAGVPPRGPMGPRSRLEEGEAQTPSGGLLGRLMDSVNEVRRDLARAEAERITQQRQLDALTATLNQLLGIVSAHQQAVNDYMRRMGQHLDNQPPTPQQ